MSESEKRSPLTLEDLLHLKRAERPSPEFWTRFEAELRQKQLAALIDRRPWWQALPQLLVQRRALVPIGATALLAVTLVTIKLGVSHSSDQAVPANLEQLAVSDSFAPVTVADPANKQSLATAEVRSEAKMDLPAGTVQVADVSLSANLPERAAELTPWSAPRQAQALTVKFFASRVEQPDRAEARLVKALVNHSVPAVENRAPRSGGAGDELASASALVSKRTRLLAQFGDRQFVPEPQAPALVRERLARRLADATNGSDHFTRVGLKGDQVSLRF